MGLCSRFSLRVDFLLDSGFTRVMGLICVHTEYGVLVLHCPEACECPSFVVMFPCFTTASANLHDLMNISFLFNIVKKCIADKIRSRSNGRRFALRCLTNFNSAGIQIMDEGGKSFGYSGIPGFNDGGDVDGKVGGG